MNIADILGNLPKANENALSTEISKKTEIRRIKSRIENYITEIINYLGEENNYIQNNLSYGGPNRGVILSDEDKKELINFLVSEVKKVPEKITTEINSFFEGVNKSSDSEEKASEPEEKASENVKVSVFGY